MNTTSIKSSTFPIEIVNIHVRRLTKKERGRGVMKGLTHAARGEVRFTDKTRPLLAGDICAVQTAIERRAPDLLLQMVESEIRALQRTMPDRSIESVLDALVRKALERKAS